MTSKKQLCRDLRQLGVQPGDVLLVHSAMKPLGPVEDTGEPGFFSQRYPLLRRKAV